METNPLAKINLGLNIVEKRPDGYHNLQTVFYPIGITDRLTISEAPRQDAPYTFTTNLPFTPNPEDNLVVRALNAMRSLADIPPVAIHLEKRIPSGAGLGGGSSDAAFTLRMLRDMFAPSVTDTQLEATASKLGADCAFFVKSQPVYAEGIGDLFSPVSLTLRGHTIVVVKTDDSVSTKEAYSGITPQMPPMNIRDIVKLPVSEWKRHLTNDFERHIFISHPAIADVKQRLYDLGADYASMSGSGAAVFGIFSTTPQFGADSFPGCFFWKGEM